MSGATGRIGVILVDDDQSFRANLRAAIDAEPCINVIGEASTCHEATDLLVSGDVQVIITEATSDGGCRALLDELHRSGLDIGLIVLTGSERSDDVLSLVQAGAAAYLHKTESFAELVCAVRTVAQGGRILDPQALEAILRDYRARCHGAAENVLCRLTTREREVLVRVADGSSTRQIADDLHMSQKTVAVHRQRIMAKLGMHKVAHLVRYAVREGLVEPE